MSSPLSPKFIGTLAVVVALLSSVPAVRAQLTPASPPLADPADKRFQDVREDMTSPGLATSHLKPAQPLEFVTDNPRYTSELVRVQWRWGDPIDLYVIKPKGVKQPPVILYLYGYPTDTGIFKNDAFEDLVTRTASPRSDSYPHSQGALSRPSDEGMVSQRIAGIAGDLSS